MGRNLVGFCGLLVAIGLACQPAQAGDRKSTGQLQETAKAILIAPETRAAATTHERPGASTVGVFEHGYSVSAPRGSTRGKENAPAREHKPPTLFHFNSKFGEVAVQPVIGKVNGAQFSVGF